MAVYNVCTICAIGVPLALVIYTQHHNLYFYVVAISIVSCTTLTLCLVFVPKVSTHRAAFSKVSLAFKNHFVHSSVRGLDQSQ